MVHNRTFRLTSHWIRVADLPSGAPPARPHYRCPCAVCSSCWNWIVKLNVSRGTPHDSTHPSTFAHSSPSCRRAGLSSTATSSRANRTTRIEFRTQYLGEMTVADTNAQLDYYNTPPTLLRHRHVDPGRYFVTLQEAA